MAFFTPRRTASVQHSTLGIMPPEMQPLSTSRSTSARVTREMRVSESSRFCRRPGTSVMQIMVSAPSAAAMRAAAVSALMLYTFCSASKPTVDTTGM